MKRFFFTLLAGFIAFASTPAIGDSAPRNMLVCSEPQMHTIGFESRLEREELVRESEVIVDGYIESYRAPEHASKVPGIAILRIDKVWKGDLTPRVALLVYSPGWFGYWPLQPQVPDCSNPMRASVQVRISAATAGKMRDLNSMFPEIDPDTDVIDRASPYLPLHDADLATLLERYQAKTEPLRKAAETGNNEAKLAFAAHLLGYNEQHRAFAIYDQLQRDNPHDLDLLLTLSVARKKARIDDEPETTLAVVRERAPKTEKWRSKIARARLAATSVLTAEGKDWTGLKRMHTTCYSHHENFDGVLFDRAELPECAFRYSSFRGTSFRGADLTGSYFQDSDLTGAQYDCATRLPDDLDPVATGMVNVDGSCAKP